MPTSISKERVESLQLLTTQLPEVPTTIIGWEMALWQWELTWKSITLNSQKSRRKWNHTSTGLKMCKEKLILKALMFVSIPSLSYPTDKSLWVDGADPKLMVPDLDLQLSSSSLICLSKMDNPALWLAICCKPSSSILIGLWLTGCLMAAIFGKKFVPMISSGEEPPMSMPSNNAKVCSTKLEIAPMHQSVPQQKLQSRQL